MKFNKLILLLLILNSCEKSTNEIVSDHFYLESKGSTMPVFVKGNINSKVCVIFLHGGPGSTSLESYQNKNNPFYKLQQHFAVVYWDQRNAGSSWGNSTEPLSLKLYTEDLTKLIKLLQFKYSSDLRFVLVGHSWGGSLGINYLADSQNQQNVIGWIEIGGGHNVPRIVELEKEMILNLGQQFVQSGLKTNEWNSIITEANSLNIEDKNGIFGMNRLANQSESLIRKMDSVNSKIENNFINDFFFSPIDPFAESVNENRTFQEMELELSKLNLSDDLPKIKIPTLLLWGKYDFRVPPKFAFEELEKYGSTDKKLMIFKRSAHYVHLNEPDLVYEELLEFINSHL